MIALTAAISLFLAASVQGDRTFTVTNNCAYTVWPAIFTDPNVGSAHPDQPNGWEAAPGNTVSFSVPDNWSAGRIWGRRDCDFSNPDPGTQCPVGGCPGGLVCNGTGDAPATLAEFTLGTNGSPDYYDVSVVDGFNLPITVTNNAGCSTASCPVDLDASCPSELALTVNAKVEACKSACAAGIDDDNGNSPNCCTGSHNTPATCPPSDVDYYSFFKGNCPDAYAYAYDESSGTALWTCDSTLAADYTVTFCP
ncbi:hypothetical protein CERSUDRAFT_95144 [Gelatoporia subvermispora B]|uniref:Thaumatin-like protein n=1 Tax=Ceriporiopsis subvermispora (strain B) TaxID=914234 RepID=M2REJ4_CERS8|nr:hypothetical protein CERSUDRAFT_95144 [Gelatoporia subvermispora B]